MSDSPANAPAAVSVPMNLRMEFDLLADYLAYLEEQRRSFLARMDEVMVNARDGFYEPNSLAEWIANRASFRLNRSGDVSGLGRRG